MTRNTLMWRAAFALINLVAASPSLAQWYQGPSGAPLGQAFDDWSANGKARNIRRVHIYTIGSSGLISCVRTYYPNKAAPNDPNQAESASIAGVGCNPGTSSKILQFKLDLDEYIVGVSGTYSDRITSLRFYTNKKNSAIYGDSQAGTNFGYTAPNGQMIVAFTGAVDTYLRSIGVMYAQCDQSTKACK